MALTRNSRKKSGLICWGKCARGRLIKHGGLFILETSELLEHLSCLVAPDGEINLV